jgi:peptide/nickel transport system substrate-binding protein
MSYDKLRSFLGGSTGPRALRAMLAPAVVAAAFLPALAGAQDQTVKIVLAAEPASLEACQAMSNAVGRVNLHNVVESLIQRDKDTGELVPHLATSWKQLDELTWRFDLRQGVVFHDGTPFNAEAAKYAIDRSMNPNLVCEVRAKYFGDKKLDVKVVGDYALEIRTEDPNPILPLLMSMHTMYSTKTPFNETVRDSIGSGPYRIVEWAAGQRIVLERNPNYWGEKPEVARVEYQWRSESSVRAAMVQRGEADLAPNIAMQDVTKEIGRAYPNSETTRLNLDSLKAPLSDVRIRAAINHAIDREALRGTVLSPEVIPATHIVLPQINGHNPDVEVLPYDPDLARKLIADAREDGVPVDTEIEFVGRIGHFPGVEEL